MDNVNSIIGPALIGKVCLPSSSLSHSVRSTVLIYFSMHILLALQDPTEQTEIDNFMVHELDGTQNEWGWCKQKVYFGIVVHAGGVVLQGKVQPIVC